jgi:hypothetical protein
LFSIHNLLYLQNIKDVIVDVLVEHILPVVLLGKLNHTEDVFDKDINYNILNILKI